MISDTPAPRPASYEQFFGFSDPPFSLSASPRFRFPSAAHEEALLQVMYALQRREPVIVVTGDIGLGKTLLCRTVLERLPRKTFLSVINDPMLGPDDLLKGILRDFGLISTAGANARPAAADAPGRPTRHDLVHTLHTFLASLVPLDAHAVVIIDEAQHVQPEVLEQIRLLANTSDDRGTLLQIVLVGQPSLLELLAGPGLQQLRQRITRSVSLSALTDAEVKQYIVHRLAVAREADTGSPMPGADALAREVARWNETSRPVEFTDAAIDTVARISRGVPRMVNVLCDRALEAAFAAQTRTVDAPDIERAARLLPLHDAGGAPASDAPAASAPAIDHLAANTPVIETPAIETPAFAASAAAEPETRELATAEARMAPRTDAPADAHEAMFAQSAPATEDIDRPAPSGAGRYAAVAAVVILGAALAVFSLRTLGGGRGTTGDAGGASAPPLQTPRDETPAAAPQPAPAAQSAPASQPTPAPESAPATAAQPEPVAPLPAATPNPPAAAPAAATDGSFEIVIASFRTETRAAQVVAELTALGHQARARVIGEWQQVVAGPFATRAAAEEAQRQLDSQGYTATHIVPAS